MEQEVDWAISPPAVLRRAHRRASRGRGAMPPGVTCERLPRGTDAPGGLWFRPDGSDGRGSVLYVHGGGFVAGGPVSQRVPAAWLVHAARAPVLAIRYRLVPEHPWPAQPDDVASALDRLPNGPVVLAGHSAGAAVALGAVAGSPELRACTAAMLLLGGGYGTTVSASIHRLGSREGGLDTASLEAMYARLGPAARLPEDLIPAAVPTTLLMCGTLDPLLDDSRLMADLLRSAGGDVRLDVPQGLDHAFPTVSGIHHPATTALTAAGAWIRDRLEGSS